MKNKKVIFNGIATALILGFVTPVINANAQETPTSQEQQIKSPELSQKLIKKVDPMIKLTNGKFNISNKDLKKLNKEEQNKVKNALNIVNENINSSKNTQTKVDPQNKTISQTVYEKNTSGLRAAPKEYVYAKYTWWGVAIYFSHKAITNLNDFLYASGTIGSLGANEAVRSFLAKNGLQVASKFLGPVALYGTGIGWGMSKVDKGNGVWLNCVLYVPATITAA